MLNVSFSKKECRRGGYSAFNLFNYHEFWSWPVSKVQGWRGWAIQFFSIAFKLYLFSFFNGSKKMRHLNQITLKWHFFLKYHKKCSSVRVLPPDPICDMLKLHLFANLKAILKQICGIFEAKTRFLSKSSHIIPLSKIQVTVSGAIEEAKEA